MRSVNYTVTLTRIDSGNIVRLQSYERERPLADFVFGELSGQWFKLVPPIEVLNQELKSGGAVVLGSEPNEKQFFFNWIPFEIESGEYRELVAAALQLPGRPFECVEPPTGIRLPQEWAHWALARFTTLP